MSDRSPPWTAAAARWAPLALAAVILVWHAHRYDFVSDDAYISLVFARNLAEHGQLTFNLGDPVEGYTNFLWTFLLGALMVVGVPAPWAARWLGVGFGLGTLVVTFGLGERLFGRGSPLAGVAPLLLASSSGFACWSSGGLETQLYTFLITLALDGYVAAYQQDGAARARALRRMAIALALSAMTRPEGLLLSALFVVHRVLANLVGERRWRPARDELVACAWFLGLWAPWFAWRWWYYGWPFPNTYYVKAAGEAVPGYESKMWKHGGHYVARWIEQTRLAWGGWLLVLGLWPRSRPALALVTLTVPLTGVYLLYAASVGGDFMGLHRFVMPLFVVVALWAALGLDALATLVARLHARAGVVAAAVVAVVLVAGFARDQQALTARSLRDLRADQGIDTPGYLKLYAHDRLLIGSALARCVKPDDFAIYGGVGALPWTARLRGVDVFGLVSDKVAHRVPRTRDRPGHNKWAPDALLAEYRPTIILHCYDLRGTPGPSPLGHCDHGTWERAGFEKLVLHVPGLRERGEYLTFLARKDRALDCPGLSR